MPSEYKVQTVVKDEEWDGKDDRMRTTELLLEGQNRTYKLIGKAKYQGPSEGDTLFGELDEQKGKFIPRRRQNGDQPSPSSGGSKEGPSEEYWEAKNRAIQRQAAHKVMCQVYELGRTEGIFEKATSAENFRDRLKEIADWLCRDTERAKEADLDSSVPF